MNKYLTLLLLLLAFLHLPAQQTNIDLSTLPIRLPLSMAGGFAEIRSNHFHSGIDLRTDGKEGERVYAPADGYVSRINISAWGGGKVLYITHPNGYRTVYMHLSAFCGKTGQFVNDYQYQNHVYAFDIDLPKDSIPVKKGELVALTGNTGGSAGPHLHYEIRLAENDQTINPLYFGLSYNDPIAPTIAGIKLYPADSRTSINGKNRELKLQNNEPVRIAGRFYCGIYTFDGMEQGSTAKNGVEKIELYVDGELLHRYHVHTFMFEETRAVNAIIDYPQYQRTREYYIVSRTLRGDRNNFSIAYRDNGYIKFDDNKTHTLEYRVSDHKGNTTRRTIKIQSDTSALLPPTSNRMDNILADGIPIAYYKSFNMVREGFCVDIDPYSIYDNDRLTYSTFPDPASLTPQHRIGLKRNPLPPHNSITVKLLIPSGIPTKWRDKLIVVCINGKNVSACSTREEKGWLTATSRSFGGFAVRMDTVAPTVKPINFVDGKSMKEETIRVRIDDNLSGVASYDCYINGEWTVAEHAGKSSSLNVPAYRLRKGINRISFRVTDAVGNSCEKSWKIYK